MTISHNNIRGHSTKVRKTRQKMCGKDNKVKYKNIKQASTELNRCIALYGKDYRVYKCDECGCYHLTCSSKREIYRKNMERINEMLSKQTYNA